MPMFYFHLGLGDRILMDDEGIELASRAAARAEAHATIRELAATVIDPASGRPTSWFLRVADEQGSFLHLPVGRPALEVVSTQSEEPTPSEVPTQPAEAPPAAAAAALAAMLTALIAEALERHQHTARLMERNRQLRDALLSEFLASQRVRQQTTDLLAAARSFGSGSG
jgi:hypothetical protein